MDARQQRRQTARAARELLQDRVPVVEELATKKTHVEEADDAVAAAQARLDETRQDYARQYEAATRVGWSADELRRLGCEPPSAGKRARGSGRTRRAAPSSATPGSSSNGQTGSRPRNSGDEQPDTSGPTAGGGT